MSKGLIFTFTIMKNKYEAALLAIFFGGLGLHKFYLGKWGQGLIYILFMFTFIPWIISFFEGLNYLCKSKEEFDILYNVKYMRNKDYIKLMNEEEMRNKKENWEKGF